MLPKAERGEYTKLSFKKLSINSGAEHDKELYKQPILFQNSQVSCIELTRGEALSSAFHPAFRLFVLQFVFLTSLLSERTSHHLPALSATSAVLGV